MYRDPLDRFDVYVVPMFPHNFSCPLTRQYMLQQLCYNYVFSISKSRTSLALARGGKLTLAPETMPKNGPGGPGAIRGQFWPFRLALLKIAHVNAWQSSGPLRGGGARLNVRVT